MAICPLDLDSTKLYENATTGHSVLIGQMFEEEQIMALGLGAAIKLGDEFIIVITYGTANRDIPTLFMVKLEVAAGARTTFYEELFGADTVEEAYEHIKSVMEKRAR